MKQTLTTYDVAHALLADENADWTYRGAFTLAEILEQYEEEIGEELEFDRVAIRCEWNEATAEELLSDYGDNIINTVEDCIEYVENNTEIYTIDNEPPTYLYRAF